MICKESEKQIRKIVTILTISIISLFIIIQSPVGPEYEIIVSQNIKAEKEAALTDTLLNLLLYYEQRHIEDGLEIESWKLAYKDLNTASEQIKFNLEHNIK